MSLFFGNTEVENNSILYPSITATTPEYVSPFLGTLTVLLLNSTKNKLYWFNYKNVDIIPYTHPTDSGRYAFIIFDSNEVTLPTKIYQNDFTVHHKPSDFTSFSPQKEEKNMFKIIFEVRKNPLLQLPPDLTRFLFQHKDTSITDLLQLCESDPSLNKRVCENPAFYQGLARQRLTADHQLISKLSNTQIYNLVDVFETTGTLNLKDLLKYLKSGQSNVKPEDLIKYEIGLAKLLLISTPTVKYFYDIAAREKNVKALMIIYEKYGPYAKRNLIFSGFHGMVEPYRTKYITDYLTQEQSSLSADKYNNHISNMITDLIGEIDEDDNMPDYPEERREVLHIILNLSGKSEEDKTRYLQEFDNVNQMDNIGEA